MTDNVLSYTTWLGYGVGHVLNDVCSSMWFTYFLIFFKKVLKFSNRAAGTALLIGQVADGISTPIVGILADKRFDFWLFKYGRRKVWHLIGTICVISSFPFVFSPFWGYQIFGTGKELLYYSLFIIVFQFGWASTQISHLSLVPDLTPNEDERTSLLTIRYSFSVLSNLAVYFIFWNILRITTEGGKDSLVGPDDLHKFQIVAYLVVGLGSFASFIFHVFVKDKSHSAERNQTVQISRLSVLTNRRTYKIACVYMSTTLFVNLGQVYITLYLQDTLHLTSEYLAILPFVMYVSGYITSFVIKPLNVEFGRKITYGLGALFGVGTCVWIFFGHDYYYKKYEIYGVVAAYGCFGSVMLVTSLGIVADLIGSNNDTGALTYGIMSFCDKISNGLAVFVIEEFRTYHPDRCYYKKILTFVCGGVAIFGFISVLWVKPAGYDRLIEDSACIEVPNAENDQSEDEDNNASVIVPEHNDLL